jgi:FkbM family methyltransferase
MNALEHLLAHIEAPLTLVDVGARWGVPKHWEALGKHAVALCFEPDADETARLAAQAPPNVRYIPAALGAPGQSSATLHVTEQPACSSIYPPLRALHEHYPALSEVKTVRTVDIPLQTMDAVLSGLGAGSVDMIKLDTQGSELDILRGSLDALKHCALIDVEVEFNPIYKGQPLFCDVDRFMRDNGFELWRLSDICHYATEKDLAPKVNIMMAFSPPQEIYYLPYRGGQIFWAMAQYVRTEYPRTGKPTLDKAAGIRAAACVAASGFWDLALEILSKSDPALGTEIRALLQSQELTLTFRSKKGI